MVEWRVEVEVMCVSQIPVQSPFAQSAPLCLISLSSNITASSVHVLTYMPFPREVL